MLSFFFYQHKTKQNKIEIFLQYQVGLYVFMVKNVQSLQNISKAIIGYTIRQSFSINHE